MANYYGKTRTNYFSVTDADKFREIIGRVKANEDAVEVIENDKGQYGFMCEGSIQGFPMTEDGIKTRIQDIKEGDKFYASGAIYIAKYDAHQNFDEPDEPWIVYDTDGNSWFEEDIDNYGDGCDYDFDSFTKALQEILPADDAVIITEIGSEKMRYFTAFTVIVTKTETAHIDLLGEAMKKARELLGSDEFVTQADY